MLVVAMDRLACHWLMPPGRQVEMIDINQRAVDLAKGNAQRNGIENVDIHASNIYETLNQSTYAAILSNPPIRAGKRCRT